MLEELRALAAAEAECCPFVEWKVLSVGGTDVPTLQVTAKDLPSIEGIAGLFGAKETEGPSR